MAKVLFFNSPMYGHVLPTLPLVEELVARGEQIIYYLTDEFAQDVCRAGATMRSYTSTMKHNRPAGRFSRLLSEECQYVLPQIIERVRGERPDYIIYEENCLWGRILSQAFPVPAISCRASLAVNEHFSHIPHLLDQGSSTATFKLLVDTLQDLAPLADLCAAYRLPVPQQDIDSLFFHAEQLNIIFASRLVQPAGETFDERFVFVGSTTAEKHGFRSEDRLVPTLPTLYISLGTIYNEQPDFYRLCLQAFAEQPWKIILAIGKSVDPAQLGPVPETVSIYDTVQQCVILQQTSLFITHGGLNSLMEALYYGVPMVIIPQMPEQVITARRILDLGVGVMLDRDALTIEALREAVATLLRDSEVREHMGDVQKEVQRAGGVKLAVDAIQRFVSTR